MLAVSPLRNSNPCEKSGDAAANDDFSVEFDFDFSELFAGFEDGEVLPGLDVDSSEIMLDFSSPETVAVEVETVAETAVSAELFLVEENKEDFSGEMMGERSGKIALEENSVAARERERGRKPAAGPSKGSNGRKKMKVDWTPELHRQFVQAVEQLGVEKAVPSRILELMGIDCLTRHNIASHLQKYRSHRKHMLVREAETTSWSQRRHVRAMTSATAGGIIGPTREINPWLAPPMGFPPGAPHHHHIQMHGFRPLHVWGHPTVDQSVAHLWPPKHMFPIRPVPSPPWGVPHPPFQHPPPQPYSSPWNPHFSKESLTQGTPYFAQQVPTMRFPAPPMAGIPPHTVYRPGDALPTATTSTLTPTNQTDWLLQHNAYPSKESIDAAIGEVLAQPWLPVPLGLKPPSLESVMVELQKQGISVVPP